MQITTKKSFTRFTLACAVMGLALGVSACSKEKEKREERSVTVNSTVSATQPLRDVDVTGDAVAPIRPMPNGTIPALPGEPVPGDVPGTTTGMTGSGMVDSMDQTGRDVTRTDTYNNYNSTIR